MKLAVLSDIHGNQAALEAVMQDLIPEHPDRVIVAGDLVNRGPDNCAVLEIVAEQGWEVIEGNHDRLIADWVHGNVPPDWRNDPWYAPLAWVAEQLTDWVGYLESLPFEARIAVDGAPPVLVVHGSPRDSREGLHHFVSDADMEEILVDVEEPLVVCAHTHIPLDRCVNGRRIVNVGAVGVPFNRDPRAQYGLFRLLDDGSWGVELRAVEYDRQPMRDAFGASGYVDVGVAAQIFLHEFEAAQSFLYRFERWAEAEGRMTDRHAWLEYLGLVK